MNIFLHEIREYRKSILIWAGAISFLAVAFLSLYPAFSKDVAQMNKLFEGFPIAVRKALGLSIESFTSLLGFYAYLLLYVTLCGSIQAMNLGTSILSKEVRDKTADFLFTKPAGRGGIMTAKIIAVLVSVLVTDMVYFVVSGSMAAIISTEPLDIKLFFMLTATLLFVQLFFVALGMLFSAVARKIKSVISISLGTVFSFFVINMFGSVIGENNIRYFTPFKYFDSMYIIKNASFETQFLLLEFILVIVFIAASYYFYLKKDIHTI